MTSGAVGPEATVSPDGEGDELEEDDAGPKSVEAQPQLWNPDGWPLHGPALLLLVTRGLEDVAVEVLLRRGASALRQLEARRLQQPQHHHDTSQLRELKVATELPLRSLGPVCALRLPGSFASPRGPPGRAAHSFPEEEEG
eukprot:CAMPEP_0115097606 /NCGR_PEP_ID=MMETSP0227-20121206/30592_1 /TAXON_ID=89957 /ORGANISM="Polarella glacialis, Strain CCMP 1383" /LENGTH=140 /DNA_ID=CAMNT_0002491909 /DNA_START=57 /DNA_END=475 /DNA_ORIENTATION=+